VGFKALPSVVCPSSSARVGLSARRRSRTRDAPAHNMHSSRTPNELASTLTAYTGAHHALEHDVVPSPPSAGLLLPFALAGGCVQREMVGHRSLTLRTGMVQAPRRTQVAIFSLDDPTACLRDVREPVTYARCCDQRRGSVLGHLGWRAGWQRKVYERVGGGRLVKRL
jgi:hypothetical protein